MRIRHLLPALLLLVMPIKGHTKDLSGMAEIIDGDTLRINGAVIELWGFDAPEPDQSCHIGDVVWACGQAATDHITTFTRGQTLSCTVKPGNEKTAASYKCAVGTLDIGAEMIEVGLALPFWPASERYYLRSYQEARGQGRGMHRGSFEEPWAWRQNQLGKLPGSR